MEAEQMGESASEVLQAVHCAQSFLRDFDGPQKEQIPLQIFAALVALFEQHLRDGVDVEKVKFDSKELTKSAREVAVLKGPPEGKESSWINKHWSKLDRLLDDFQEELEKTARSQGLSFIPSAQKDQSRGGARHRSYYRLTARPVSASREVVEYEIPPGGIRYASERRRRTPWLARLYIGVPLRGLRRYAVIALYAALILLGLLVMSPLVLRAFTQSEIDLAEMALGLVAVTGIFYSIFGALVQVATWKVSVAPELFRPWDDLEPFLLEEVRDPNDRKAPKTIELVKYSGQCPVCGGRVVVGGGGLRFWARLVGRCQRSPREHVFSFDHVTKLGAPLWSACLRPEETSSHQIKSM